MSLRSFAALASVFCALGAQARGGPLSADEVTRRVSAAVDRYAAAIACRSDAVKAADIAALEPYDVDDNAMPFGRYAVIWTGDIGCQQGSASISTNIAVVEVRGTIGDFLVVPAHSSPQAAFALPFAYEHRIVGHTADTLTLEGVFLGAGDALCCASDRRRYTLRSDDRGTWSVVSERHLDSTN